jgi:hypothetical protein
MHLLFFVGFSSILALAQPPATSPSQWPGWSNLRNCVQNAIVNYNMYYAGCGDWQCMCEHGSIAEADILSAVINECSSNEPDIAVATSIFNGFCSQLPGVTDFQAVPASTASPVAGLTASPATATPTCNYSQLHVLI